MNSKPFNILNPIYTVQVRNLWHTLYTYMYTLHWSLQSFHYTTDWNSHSVGQVNQPKIARTKQVEALETHADTSFQCQHLSKWFRLTICLFCASPQLDSPPFTIQFFFSVDNAGAQACLYFVHSHRKA